MANITIPMGKIRLILRLHWQGKTKLYISQHTGTSRNTVKKYLERQRQLHLSYEDTIKMSDVELDVLIAKEEPIRTEQYEALMAYLSEARNEMRRPEMTRRKLWERYKEQHPDGYMPSQFYTYFRRYAKQISPVLRIDHKAGDKMQVDYAGDRLAIVDSDSGNITEVQVFVAILPASQLTYVEATYTQKIEDFVTACENAMHFFGGVPAAIVPDNLKAAVTKSSRYEPTINETFADFAEHYQTAIVPARAYKPRDKAHVENAVKIVYRRYYPDIKDRVFHSLADLNAALAVLTEHHNNATMQRAEQSRRERFEEIERQALRPLPALRYEFRKHRTVKAMKNCYVYLSVDRHYYSVPYTFIGKQVKIVYNSAVVEIYHQLDVIACHPRETKQYGYTTIKEHLPSTHGFVADWSADKFIREAERIGETVKVFVERLLASKPHPEQGYKSCMGVLRLASEVGGNRLETACRRALDYQKIGYGELLRILERNLDQLPIEENVAMLPKHNNIRGTEYYG